MTSYDNTHASVQAISQVRLYFFSPIYFVVYILLYRYLTAGWRRKSRVQDTQSAIGGVLLRFRQHYKNVYNWWSIVKNLNFQRLIYSFHLVLDLSVTSTRLYLYGIDLRLELLFYYIAPTNDPNMQILSIHHTVTSTSTNWCRKPAFNAIFNNMSKFRAYLYDHQ